MTWQKDIRFWIILFFLLRLISITDAPLEVAHNWRQTTVTMVSRNFVETSNNIFYPRVDFAGEKTGITGMEFPFLNYLIYLVSLVTGYAHWYGRIINLFISSFGLYYFYLLVRKYFDEGLAFKASFILLFSVWFTYSRKIMPDTFSMSLVFIGIYHGTDFLDGKKKTASLLLYFIFTSLGILSKLPSGFLVVLIGPLLLKGEIELKGKILISVVTIPIIALVTSYYFYWVPYLNQRFEFSHFFMGKGISTGFMEIKDNLNQALEKFYEEALGYIGFFLFMAGIVIMFVKRNNVLVTIFLLSFFAFLVVIFRAGFAFYHHAYYIIPFAPIMALLSAYAIQEIGKPRIVNLLLFLIALECVLNKYHDFYIKKDNLAILELEYVMDKVSAKTDLVLINSGNVPTPMYFAHRKGWIENNSKISEPYISGLKAKGLKFIIILKNTFGSDMVLSKNQVFENDHFRIYEL